MNLHILSPFLRTLRSTLLILTLLLIQSKAGFSNIGPMRESQKSSPPRIAVANPNTQNRVHRRGNIWMNMTNWGFFGNYAIWGSEDKMEDPEYPGTWAPQCEFPGGSNVQYLYQGSLWIGALVQEAGFEYPRVSTGTDGWARPRVNEFYPGEGSSAGIIERSTRPNFWNRLGVMVSSPDAVSEQDFIAVYTDTLRDRFWVNDDPVDGEHFPLGIKITQQSYAWSQNFARDFILIDYQIENIASNYLKNVYVGLYIDADVGREDEQPHWMNDDICGFQRYYYYTRPDGQPDSVVINMAWIADNDGRPYDVIEGSDFYSPDVTGVRVVRAPNPRLKTSFNWWISNADPELDFGPCWQIYADSTATSWMETIGTPEGDAHKYQILSNREFDYDQVYVDQPDWIDAHPQQFLNDQGQVIETELWLTPNATNPTDLANGYDTRYLLSWGPLGIFDHIDPSGRRIYRLNPGEKFNMTIAYVAAENFHDYNNPQGNPEQGIDPSKFNFADMRYNAVWAARVYDNPMVDTDGDGWYGEDVGNDRIFARLEPGQDSVYVIYFQGTSWAMPMGWYTGPDADGSEQDGRLQPVEDTIIPDSMYLIGSEIPQVVQDYGRWDMGWMANNGVLDIGDGIPDFTGPPPPPIPALQHYYPNTENIGGLGYEVRIHEIVIRWSTSPSEDPDYQDPFSRVQDFEGYRIYVGNTNLDGFFSLVADYDRIDYAYMSDTDSLVSFPDPRPPGTGPGYAPPDTTIETVTYHRRAYGNNTGFSDIQIPGNDSTYEMVFPNTAPLFPRWYSVVAYDFGDARTGTEPLATSPTANSVYIAPSGNPNLPVRVVPNPYRAYEDYTRSYSNGLRWENQDDGTPDFFPQTDRRLEFINLPRQCLIRVFTLAGDLVAIIPHNITGDSNNGWVSEYSERWDMNNRNQQQIVSGIYLFSVEDKTPGHNGNIETGKFVVIR
jgi:hypothetical protein